MKKGDMKKVYLLVMLVLLAYGTAHAGGRGEERQSQKNDPDKVSVFASILPQKYFIERVGGEKVKIDVMVKPGQSPETYEPTPDQIIKLSKTDVFFTIGVPFEAQFLPSISSSLKNLRIADSSDGVTKRYMKQYEEVEDHHDDYEGHDDLDDHEHAHGEGAVDPHIWLSPVAVKIQAVNIFNTLSEIDPENRNYYRENLDRFIKDLDDVHTILKEILAPYRGKTIFVFHPAFGYFTDEYGLLQEAIETGGKDPAPATLMKIIDKALEEEVKIIFVQPEFPKKSAESVAQAIKGSVVVLNPLNPDYINNLLYLAEEVRKALIK